MCLWKPPLRLLVRLLFPFCLGFPPGFIHTVADRRSRLAGLWGLMNGLTAPSAALAATIVVIFLSRTFAVRERCPVTIFLISGIFPLVPGAGIYWTAYYIVTDELALAVRTGFLACKVAVAIVLGIVFVFELPQKFFYICCKETGGSGR